MATKKYTIQVTLIGVTEAEDEDEAFDDLLDHIEGRHGMEILRHEIREYVDGDHVYE